MKVVTNNKVVPIRPVVRRRDRKPEERHCRHGGEMLICPDTQLVQCGVCSAWLSAFEALRVLTRRWEEQTQATKYATYRLESVRKEFARLKRDEENTKTRLRNARRRLKEVEQQLESHQPPASKEQ